MKKLLLLLLASLLVGCSSNNVKIGFVAGLTGVLADEAIATRNGFILAVEEANSNGGINGKEIIPVIKDDASNINTANDMAIEFNQENVHLIVGPFLSSMEDVVRDGMKNFDHLYVSPSMATSNLSGEDDNFYRVISDNTLMARDLYKLVKSTGVKRTIILQDMTNEAFTNVLKEELVKQMANSDIAFLGIIEIDEALDKDEVVQRVQASQADSVILLTGSVKSAEILQAFQRDNIQTTNFVSTWALSNALIANAGNASEDLYGVGFYDEFSEDQKILEFREKYIKRFNSSPASTSILAYDATRLMIRAISEADSTRVDKVKIALDNIQTMDGVTGSFMLDDNGDVDRSYVFLKIQNGEIRSIK